MRVANILIVLFFAVLILLTANNMHANTNSVSADTESFYATKDVLQEKTAKTYRKELKTLIALLAYRVKRLLPNEKESLQNKQRGNDVADIANDLNVDKYKSPKESFQNSPPTAAFNVIKKRARAPKQMGIRPTIGGVGGASTRVENDALYANSSPKTRTLYADLQNLPKPVQIYLMASRDWYSFYNQSLTVVVNTLLRQRTVVLEAKGKQKEQRKETTQQNKKRLTQTSAIKNQTLNKYGISE